MASPLLVATSHRLLALRFASRSGVVTAYATHFPSGEICASLTRCILIMSSKVIACFVSCAGAPAAQPRTHTSAQGQIAQIFIFFLQQALAPPREVCIMALSLIDSKRTHRVECSRNGHANRPHISVWILDHHVSPSMRKILRRPQNL